MFHKLSIIYSFVICLFALNVNSQTEIILSDIKSNQNIEPYIEVYSDKCSSPKDLENATPTKFKPYSWDNVPNDASEVWLRFTVNNTNGYEETMVLGNNQFQYLEFYELNENNEYTTKLGGLYCDHNLMDIVLGANTWFSFIVPSNKISTYYIRASNVQKIKYQYSKLPFTIYSQSEFKKFQSKQTFFNYFFWGALLIITFYNLTLYFQLKNRIYLYYVFNNIIILLFVLSQSGFISELFFNDSKYHENLLLVFGNVAFIFYVLFCKEFLGLELIKPKLNSILNKVLLFWPVPLLLILINQSELAVSIGGVVAIWAYTMIMITAYGSMKKGKPGAIFFFIANWFYYIGIIISILQIAQVLPNVFLGLYAVNYVQIGTLLQVSLFSLTVGAQIIQMQQEIIEKKLEQERIKTEEEHKRRLLIEEQNLFLEQKVNERTTELKETNAELIAQSEVLEIQKSLLEEKQKEIIDSITYAKRIQYTLLANERLLNKYLPEHFVLFNPKDIVSGDFYWAIQKNDRFYLAICDCTGHGVPGAFMSLLNISFLNEAINEKDIAQPNDILNYVRMRLEASQGGAQDGMDGTLLCFTDKSSVITYASAYNKPVLIRDGVYSTLPADKMPVGKGEKQNSFSLQTLEIKPGDRLYFYTDGFTDQFGGEKGKKFKAKNLNELLTSIQSKSPHEQKQTLTDTFNKWKNNIDQIDDVCVIGLFF